MSDLFNRYPRTRTIDPKALAASLAIQAPAAPMLDPDPGKALPTPQTPADRPALVRRVLDYPGDRWALYRLVLSVQGPDAFTDTALGTMAAVLEVIEQPTTETAP